MKYATELNQAKMYGKKFPTLKYACMLPFTVMKFRNLAMNLKEILILFV